MNTFLAIGAALGGVAGFAAAVAVIIRAIARWVAASKDNSEALRQLSETVRKLDGLLDDHATRIARLEGRRIR